MSLKALANVKIGKGYGSTKAGELLTQDQITALGEKLGALLSAGLVVEIHDGIAHVMPAPAPAPEAPAEEDEIEEVFEDAGAEVEPSKRKKVMKKKKR